MEVVAISRQKERHRGVKGVGKRGVRGVMATFSRLLRVPVLLSSGYVKKQWNIVGDRMNEEVETCNEQRTKKESSRFEDGVGNGNQAKGMKIFRGIRVRLMIGGVFDTILFPSQFLAIRKVPYGTLFFTHLLQLLKLPSEAD